MQFFDSQLFTKFGILFLLPFLFFLPGCKPTITTTHFYGNAHTHSYHIQIGQALSCREKHSILSLLQDFFEEIDCLYNHWNPFSELSQINQLKAGEAFPVSSQLLHLIEEGKKLTLLTDGYFDPTFGMLIEIWKTALQKGELPDSIQDVSSGWNLFALEQGQIKRFSEKVKLDLDGLLKGFAIDEILKKVHQKGYQNIYVEWGGDIRVLGKHPSGRNWRVQLPGFEKSPIPLKMALATSGKGAQSYEINGKLYSHIIIPETKEALPLLNTVAVQAPTCLLADALATALMTFSTPMSAIKWLEKKTAFSYGMHCLDPRKRRRN